MALTENEAEHQAQIIVNMHSGTYPSGVTWCNFPELKRAVAAALIEASKITVVRTKSRPFVFDAKDECRETLGDDGRCATCGWNAKTRSYETQSS